MNYFLISYEVDFGAEVQVQRDILVETQHSSGLKYFEELKEAIGDESPFEEEMTFIEAKRLDGETYKILSESMMVKFGDDNIS